ncbi:MAG TPA: PQQ-binding-like beta-propeller repeat protein [Solirubrobacterales bacterium]|nr:PQQ-binding-like beta-propeller repeat protein [Solirubrobacterales bacterium]
MPSRAQRRRRLLLPAALLLVAIFLGIRAIGGSSGSGTIGSVAPAPKRLIARDLGKGLPAPISGEAAAVVPGGTLILGGLDASEASVEGVFLLDGSGGLRPVGDLAGPLHDAAAVVLGDRVLVFGGGTETSTDQVQSLSASASPGEPATATVVGQLPAVRSDLSAVTVGSKAYVLGGYDGTTPDPAVLATADGRSFSHVADLEEPARYMAVAALGGRIYAFGGETAEGTPTDAIQEVDPASGTARVIGRLPHPVSHAAAVALGGSIYVLGGEEAAGATASSWRFDPGGGRVSSAASLPRPIAGGAIAGFGHSAYLVGGTGAGGEALSSIVALTLEPANRAGGGKAAGAGAAGASQAQSQDPPFQGRLMIADRGNNRIIVVNNRKQVLWRYPSKAHPPPPGGFYFPDDAFFTHGGTQIISNEEQNERIVRLSFPGGKLLWSYGHAGQTGSEPGYLHEPDDAYLLRNGNVSVADAQNCRILIISPQKKVLREFGDPAECTHDPPRRLASPNGDTPLANGDILVSEVNGSYVDEITRTGKLVWSLQLPLSYPSDPQQLGPDKYLVVDYADPGGIYEFNRAGKILWSYRPEGGNGRLDHPSLAEELPSGDIAVNDDYRHRVVIIDPKTKKIVWQYGVTGHPGTGPDHLRIPDGFDLLESGGRIPTHPYTG